MTVIFLQQTFQTGKHRFVIFVDVKPIKIQLVISESRKEAIDAVPGQLVRIIVR